MKRRVEVIDREGKKLVQRFRFRVGEVAPNIYYHHFHADDHSVPHDHPFDFIAVTLWGSAKEVNYKRQGKSVIKDGIRKLRPLSLPRFYKAEHIHRITDARGLRTLCFIIRRRRQWGFWTSQGWVHYEAFGSSVAF